MDVDYDGDMDMIVNFISGEKFVWFCNDGEVNFEEVWEIISLIGRVNYIMVVDINVDGRMDFIIFFYDDSQVVWFENFGIVFMNIILGVVCLDVNGDGCDDLDVIIFDLLIQFDNGINSFVIFM